MIRSSLLFLSVAACLLSFSARAQEAVQIRPEDAGPEPTPIEEATPKKEKPPAEKPAKKTERDFSDSSRNIQDMMTAEEFNAAGLDKLSSSQLKSLNSWLQGYRQTTETKATEKATAEATKKAATESRARMDTILSRVAGPFTGVNGHTIIKLEDGTVWKQANADDRFHASVTESPPVRVIHGTFGYKMRVVGTGEFYVDPVR